MEGPELTDAVTDNFMNVGHVLLSPSQRDQVRAAVADNLANISSSIRARHPEDHAKLDLINLSQEQKESVLRVLRLYGDRRVLSLSHTIAQAVDETRAEAGDSRSLKRRLSEKLRPQLRDLQDVCDEIMPGLGKHIHLDAEDFDDLEPVQTFDKWHLQVEVTPPQVMGSGPNAKPTGLFAARRLAPSDTLGSTQMQATTVYQHLEGMLGDSMPSAPARMLLFNGQKELESKTTGWERLANCLQTHMSDLPGLVQCLMTNCKRLMAWLINKFHLGDMVEKITGSSAGAHR